ncbi:MAG TPA: response regulator [Candidatus Nitrosotenuis sp.]|jgi:PAS domain S-box-containing protein|nr:response regulator [Candidatus Nitrosotenuis sp.]
MTGQTLQEWAEPGTQGLASVLIVDDETRVAASLKGLLGEEFQVLYARGGEEALDILDRQEVAVILCDQRMPGLRGDQVLRRARLRSLATRILLTGYTDYRDLTEAVNQGQIFACLPKPWDPEALLVTVRSAARHHWLMKALQTEQRLLRALMEGSPYPIYFKDAALRFVRLNRPQAALLGLEDPARALGRTEAELGLGARAEEELGEDRLVVESGKPLVDRLRRVRLPQGERWFSCTKLPLLDENGRVEGLAALVRDVTRRQELEDQLRQAVKMESIGRLAGGVAHDFNNLLTGIMGFAQMLLEELDPTGQAAQDLRSILELTERATALTRQLLLFSRREVPRRETVDLRTLLEGTLKLLSRLLGEQVQVRAHFDPGLGPVEADPGQLEQIIVNLAVNARDAMPEGGELRLWTERASSLPPGALGCREGPGPWAVIRVQDTGTGMEPETLERIFEPFFTTKEKDRGTGLGLAVVYSVVSQHQGAMAVESQPGQGSTFSIFLPLSRGQVQAPAQVSLAPARGGSEGILLVEDEEVVRHFARRVLEGLGYQVRAAAGPREAEALFAESPDSFELLLTDVIMPGGTGPDLWRRLQARNPRLRLLCISGYSEEELGHRLGQADSFLQKPFGPGALARKVREVLDR